MRSLLTACLISVFAVAAGQTVNGSADALILRVIPRHARDFVTEQVRSADGKDYFEVGTRGGKILLRGSNGVAIAAALYAYLDEYCHCQVTWNGTNLRLPDRLPLPAKTTRKQSPWQYRYYLNYCTFNYTMAWWDWKRWEQEIDWMALHGINMPLAITGEEYTWYLVYKKLGFTDEELNRFFCGPAYFAWFWMGNLDAWGGPLPMHWMKTHYALQKKILRRERELGMRPVLPAFTGHVPPAFRLRFPGARLKTTNWHSGFSDTYILDAADPMFARVGRLFLETQQQLYGTDHFYSADTFNENEPPSSEPAALAKLSASVYEGMRDADTAAVWVMQGWLFFHNQRFWQAPQTAAMLNAVPDSKMIVLDLATEIQAVWKRTNAFYGKPWIWNMLNNFGGNTNLFGRMDAVATGPAEALQDTGRGRLQGIGLTMEAIETNPVLYELMADNTWSDHAIDPGQWLKKYVRNRYGIADEHALKAWDILRRTAYTVPPDRYIRDGAESIIQARPTFDSMTRWTNPKLNYYAPDLVPALDEMIKAASTCGSSDGFRFDLVDLTRQALANYALPLQREWIAAYRRGDVAGFNRFSREFIELIADMDRLLATRRDFLLGPWIASARNQGITPGEKGLYEKNARDLLTLWGDTASPLHEYACRQWSGMFNDFYKPRWELFFALAGQALATGRAADTAGFQKQIAAWEWKWVNKRKDYPLQPTGDPVAVAGELYHKYRKKMTAENILRMY